MSLTVINPILKPEPEEELPNMLADVDVDLPPVYLQPGKPFYFNWNFCTKKMNHGILSSWIGNNGASQIRKE